MIIWNPKQIMLSQQQLKAIIANNWLFYNPISITLTDSQSKIASSWARFITLEKGEFKPTSEDTITDGPLA